MSFNIIDFILHIDTHLQTAVTTYPHFTYGILFLIVFAETGFVITPFLPGDSLLFAAGALAASGQLNLGIVFLLITIAAILGDTINYHIGKFLGPQMFKKEDSWFFHKDHLVKAEGFYEKHGGKTIILARFIPIIRTFAPFVAGIGKMSYGKFITYNIVGGILWSAIFIFGGYLFGNIPWIEKNFEIVIIVIIAISILPIIKEFISHRLQKRKSYETGNTDKDS